MTALPPDYGERPERFLVGREVVRRFGRAGDVHVPVADRLVAEGLAPVLDVGCGDGALLEALPAGWPWIGLDAEGWDVVRVLGDAARLPVASGSVGAVTALWVLYHLEDPVAAVAEAHRAVRPGGLFATCTTARDDSPELLAHLPPQPATTFDAEEAAGIVASVFDDVEVERWDAPLVHLPTSEAVAAYLTGRGVGDDVAAEVAAAVDVPLDVTKRGVLIWARR